jgi:small GTP-binding protein
MGIEFDTQMLDTSHGKVKAQIWDTAGQERFARVLLPTYFRKAKGVILVYDITNLKSFESLSERWMAQLNDHASADDLAKLLVGNKADLEGSREVTKEKALQFCQQYNMELLETSAKTGTNVLPAFEKLMEMVHDRALASQQQNAKGGLPGINTGSNANATLQLQNEDRRNNPQAGDANACGC